MGVSWRETMDVSSGFLANNGYTHEQNPLREDWFASSSHLQGDSEVLMMLVDRQSLIHYFCVIL